MRFPFWPRLVEESKEKKKGDGGMGEETAVCRSTLVYEREEREKGKNRFGDTTVG